MSDKTIKIQCKAADVLPLDAIVEFQGGLKKRGKKEIALMIKSIEKYGFSFPFMVWKNGGQNHCLDGHGRIQALAEMRRSGVDIPLLPVVYVEAKDEEEAKNKLLRLNSQYGQMTIDSVLEFTEGIEVEFEELMLHGDTLKIKSPDSDTGGDDEAPELDEEAVSELGEIYELGPHRLMCGDSTDSYQVGRLMGGDKADLVFTDPPYGVDYEGIKNDNRSGLSDLLRKSFENYSIFSKTGASVYVFHSDKCADIFHEIFRVFFNFSSMIIWAKNSLTLSRTDYQSQHEPCLYGWIKGGTHSFYGDRKQVSIWRFDKEKVVGHTTPKPVALIEKAVINSSKSEDIVIDLFGGSGSTLIAAAKTGRKARLMEIDPKYCDVIRRRWTKWARENGHEVGSGGLEPLDAK